MYLKILLSILFLISFSSFCQNLDKRLLIATKKVDSLKNEKRTYPNDTLLVIWLSEKSNLRSAKGHNVDSVLVEANEALQLAEKIDWNLGRVVAWFNLCELENIKSRYFRTIDYALKVIIHADKKRDWLMYGLAFRNAGAASMWLDKPHDALKYYTQYFEFMQDKLNRDFVHPCMPFKKYSKLSYYDAYTELGIIHTKYLKTPDNSIALNYFKIAEKVYSEQNDSIGIGYMSSYLALCYERMRSFKLAEKTFEKSFEYLRKKKVDYLLADALNNAAEYYYRKKEYVKASEMANKALEIAKKVGIYFSLRDANKNLYLINEELGDFKKALFFHKRYSAMRDSMAEANYEDKMKVIRYEMDTQKQNEEIILKTAENERKNVFIYSLIIIFGVFSIAGYALYRNLNYRKKIADQEIVQLTQEKQLTATESILKGQEEERSRLARDLHDGLGGLLSGIKFTLHSMTGNVILSEQNASIFTRALAQLDTAISEMRRVAHSMMPEALFKFGLVDALSDYCEGITQSSKLKVHFQSYQLNQRLEQSVEVMIFRIVQELLNNTLKHAQATEVFVQLSQADDVLTLSVEDNGKGFNISELHKSKGIGIQNVKNRVAYLNGKMDIQSAEEKGTIIVIEIETK